MMAGVGPFAIPIAMKLKNASTLASTSSVSKVFANDLNPDSYKYLLENSKLNNCTSTISCYNQDGIEFIKQLDEKSIAYTDVIMNLPQNSIDFLHIFISMKIRRKCTTIDQILPIIHIYSFSSDADPIQDVRNRIAQVLQCNVELIAPTKIWSKVTNKKDCNEYSLAHIVRDVAPKKVMVCYSFKLPQEVSLC
jgi:tRNA (guanine37-N1)-methyltransferase